MREWRVETDVEVREALKARHQHVLVDEYQDVNRASVRLLKAIVGDGRNLWVVGDARQSIYRFRGASATNMAQFAADFPGAQVRQLGVNYRSVQEVVRVFTAFSDTMKASAGALPLQLTADRGALDTLPEFRVVRSTDDEILAVAYEYTYNGRSFKVGELTEDYAARKENEVIMLKLLKWYHDMGVQDIITNSPKNYRNNITNKEIVKPNKLGNTIFNDYDLLYND